MKIASYLPNPLPITNSETTVVTNPVPQPKPPVIVANPVHHPPVCGTYPPILNRLPEPHCPPIVNRFPHPHWPPILNPVRHPHPPIVNPVWNGTVAKVTDAAVKELK